MFNPVHFGKRDLILSTSPAHRALLDMYQSQVHLISESAQDSPLGSLYDLEHRTKHFLRMSRDMHLRHVAVQRGGFSARLCHEACTKKIDLWRVRWCVAFQRTCCHPTRIEQAKVARKLVPDLVKLAHATNDEFRVAVATFLQI